MGIMASQMYKRQLKRAKEEAEAKALAEKVVVETKVEAAKNAEPLGESVDVYLDKAKNQYFAVSIVYNLESGWAQIKKIVPTTRMIGLQFEQNKTNLKTLTKLK